MNATMTEMVQELIDTIEAEGVLKVEVETDPFRDGPLSTILSLETGEIIACPNGLEGLVQFANGYKAGLAAAEFMARR